jgi:hypothetical protein
LIMPRASSAGCWVDDPHPAEAIALDFLRPKHDIPASNSPLLNPRDFQEGCL